MINSLVLSVYVTFRERSRSSTNSRIEIELQSQSGRSRNVVVRFANRTLNVISYTPKGISVRDTSATNSYEKMK